MKVDFQETVKRIKGYFTQDLQVKYLMLAQALLDVFVIIMSSPLRFAARYYYNAGLFLVLFMAGTFGCIIAVIILLSGVLQRRLAKWLNISLIENKEYWKFSSSPRFMIAMLFMQGVGFFALLNMSLAIVLFLVSFDADYVRLPAKHKL